jgi:hypothetical protein
MIEKVRNKDVIHEFYLVVEFRMMCYAHFVHVALLSQGIDDIPKL